MLEEMAANDRGDHAARHLAALLAQLSPEPPLGLLAWCPRDVLELQRASTAPASEPGRLKQLLACTLLLRNAARVTVSPDWSDKDVFVRNSAASLAPLVMNSKELATPLRALAFVQWFFQAQPHPKVRPFAAFAALALASALRFNSASDHHIAEICDWVIAEEENSRTALGSQVNSSRWLIGLNSFEDHRNGRWLQLSQGAFGHAEKVYSGEIAARLGRFSTLLSEG
jgi:hypothetical protein